MAKITTTYDSTLKEKVFIVKGEEAYARTTDCVLTELFTHNGERRTDWNTSLDNMKLEFRIDVLRDVGASQVVLYDNDITLGVFDLDTNSHRIDLKWEGADEDNRIKLGYGIEHNIYAKYMGNKQCLKSQSQSYEVNESLPHSFNCDLEFVGSDGVSQFTTSYDPFHPRSLSPIPIEFRIKLVAEREFENKNIKVYNGKTLIGEYATDNNGLTEVITLSDLSDGAYKLTAIFDGSEYLAHQTNSVDISIGYIITLEEYPSLIINQEPVTIVGSIKDYLGNPPATEMSREYYAIYEEENDGNT